MKECLGNKLSERWRFHHKREEQKKEIILEQKFKNCKNRKETYFLVLNTIVREILANEILMQRKGKIKQCYRTSKNVLEKFNQSRIDHKRSQF